jgi:hypothetical protein
LECALGVGRKILMSRNYWNLFGKIWLPKCERFLFLKRFLPLKIQINFQKTRFWKEISVEDVLTLGPTAQATLVAIEVPLPRKQFLLWAEELFRVRMF